MRIERFNRAAFTFSTLATDVKNVVPAGKERNSFSSALVAVKPGKTSMPHMHHDAEIFFIVKGDGGVISQGKSEKVSVGDTIYFQPYTEHSICNYSRNEDLIYLTIWWENPRLYLGGATKANNKENRVTYIYSAAPTPNGDLHIGHLAGPYLAADVYKRFHRELCKKEVFHVCGVDENQSYPHYMSQISGIPLDIVLDQLVDQIQTSLQLAKINIDSFVRPRYSQKCTQLTQDVFNKLIELNLLTESLSEAWFCDHCDQYLHEAYLHGTCPYCREDSSGSVCEACNLYYEESSILDPSCACCKNTPQKKTISRWFFLLETYKDALLQLHNQPHTHPLIRSYVLDVFETPLPNIPITHLGNWGKKINAPDGKEIAIYSYFELLSRYLTAKPENFAISNEQIIQFLGVDNRFWRLILFPALLLAYGCNDLRLYSIANQFYELDNRKFSTSKKHVIGIKELVNDYSIDAVRLYICYTRPESVRTNFSLLEFKKFIHTELVEKWQTLIVLLNKSLNNFNWLAPEPGLWSNCQLHYFEWLQQHKIYIEKHYQVETFSPKAISRQLCLLVDEALQFIMFEQPLCEGKIQISYYRTTIALGLLSLKILAILAYPIMPVFSTSILKQLGENAFPLILDSALVWVQSKRRINQLVFDFEDKANVKAI